MTPAKKSARKKPATNKPGALSPAKRASTKSASTKSASTKSATADRDTPKHATPKRAPAKSSQQRSGAGASPPSVQKSLAKYRSKRDFSVTSEPSGQQAKRAARNKRTAKPLVFVIQKHEASHLHFDLRLEVDGVMKSWAVPKGPSVDPEVKRLAMEVEDHPIAYNSFEGTIPKGEYGGGTVMLWDNGTYSPDEIVGEESENDAARRALADGKLAFTFHGSRLKGSFALVRTRRGEERAQWLLIKHKDAHAKIGRDIVAEKMTSVETGRRMEDIANGKVSRKKSARKSSTKKAATKRPSKRTQ